VIGTNSDLELIRGCLDSEIAALSRLVDSQTSDQAWITYRLVTLGRRRIAVSATLANRRAEAAKKVVDLSRWFTGDGALGEIKGLATAEHRSRPMVSA
jgi:hypothetical protein